MCEAPKPVVSRAGPSSAPSIPKPEPPPPPEESRNRIDPRGPAARSPGLYDSFGRHKFHLSSRDISAEQLKFASRFTPDLGGLVGQVHCLHDATQLYDLVELFGIGKSIVDALAARCERILSGLRARDLVQQRLPACLRYKMEHPFQ
jgi:hypothetical protein